VGSILITFSGEHPELFDEARDFAQRLQSVHAGSITDYRPDFDYNQYAIDIGAMANKLMGILGVNGLSEGRDKDIYTLLNEIDSRASIMEQEDND
jgi:hypothetical protein